MTATPSEQCIVLPFRPTPSQTFNGTGLALHFLIGNVLVLHSGLKEMWFGWRVDQIFPDPAELSGYIRGTGPELNLPRVSQDQRVRFWLWGDFTAKVVSVRFFDGDYPDNTHPPMDLPITTDDGLVGFRQPFIDWLASVGRPLSQTQIQPALWTETIDHEGLDAVGRALERFYRFSAFGGEGTLEMSPFEQAVALAPDAFMAQDLYGWALYRNKDYVAAKIAFLKSLRINPAGAGAMSGLMWCGVYNHDVEEAMYWSARKADTCGQDVKAAREAGRRRYEKVNP